MDTIIGRLSLAAGLAVFGAALWFLVARDTGFGYWLLAAFLIGHGLVQLMFLFPQSPDAAATANGVAYPFMARSWLITGVGLDAGIIRQVGVVLIAVVAGFAVAGLATVGVLIPTGLWPPLVIVSTAASVLLLAMFSVRASFLGFASDAILLWLVRASVWGPGGIARAATG